MLKETGEVRVKEITRYERTRLIPSRLTLSTAMNIKRCIVLLSASLLGLVPIRGQNLNEVLDVAGPSLSWSGPPGAVVSSEGGAAAGETFIRLFSGADPAQSGWLAVQVEGPGWVDFQFRPNGNGTVTTFIGGFEVWPYREDSIAGARWNQGTVFLPPGQNSLRWAAQQYDGVAGAVVVDVDDVRVRRTMELTLEAALNGGSDREWRTSAETPWTGLAMAPAAWFLPGFPGVQLPCAWVRVTPVQPSAWIETTFTGPGRLSALSAVVPWAENWSYPFGAMTATLVGVPVAARQHSLNNMALQDLLIPPGQHVVRWTLDRLDSPGRPTQVADGQLSHVIFQPRLEVPLDTGLGGKGWRTSPKNPWFAIDEDGAGAISGPAPGEVPSWIEKEFDGPSILSFGVAKANDWTIDAPRELFLKLDGQDLPVAVHSPELEDPGFGIIPGGYSLVLPSGRHSVRWTSATEGGLVTLKNVSALEKPAVWLAEALGVPGALVMTGVTTGYNPMGWEPVADGYKGAPAVRSGTTSIQTWLQTWVDGPATVSFWSRFEGDFDASSSFRVDGVINYDPGTVDPENPEWRQTRVLLTQGRHLLRWSATYDGSGSGYYISRLKISPRLTRPVITVHPVSQWVKRGSSFTLQVTATGSGPLSYQWRQNGRPIRGATASTLTIRKARWHDAGIYTVEVSNRAGTVRSKPAVVRVR